MIYVCALQVVRHFLMRPKGRQCVAPAVRLGKPQAGVNSDEEMSSAKGAAQQSIR
jgi:hypothetical protein